MLSTSCLLKDESPLESTSASVNVLQSGDIVVSNTRNDSIVLLDEAGDFKQVLADSPTDGTLILNGMTYDPATRSVLFMNDLSTVTLDAIRSIAVATGAVTTYLSNSILNGTLPGLARLADGTLVVLQNGATAEKFDAAKNRVGAPFLGTLTANVAEVKPLSSGGFAVCS
jgi:hypothetical protein